jgi:hypothetical protein
VNASGMALRRLAAGAPRERFVHAVRTCCTTIIGLTLAAPRDTVNLSGGTREALFHRTPACQDPEVDPITVFEFAPGQHNITMYAGTTDVDDVISELGHEPNGYFWEGIVQLLVSTEATALKGRFEMDPEAGAFVAYGSDAAALKDLAVRLQAVASDGDRLRGLVRLAERKGFEFDD